MKTLRSLGLLCSLSPIFLSLCHAGEEPIGRFGKDNYGDWQSEGEAFKHGPVTGDLLKTLEIENDGGHPIASSEIAGDGSTGTLTSPEFRITKPYLSFRIGGGDYEVHTCIDLIIGGKTVKRATGRNSDRLTPVSWDVREFKDSTARLRIIDEATGHWGHINIGAVVQTDEPEALPLAKVPLYQEKLRPQFHFTARQWVMDRLNPGMRQDGWLNDLNGLVYYDGEYHLFAQRWNKCWIHAVSRDLIHWEELPPAFWEEKLDSAVQSGTCVIDYQNSSGLSPDKTNPPMVAFWSRNTPEHCISYSLDHGRTWSHYAKNPVLKFPERDPKVFWYEPGKHWVMMMYGNGQYHILTSNNLLDWHNEKNPIPDAFECPDFFELPVTGKPDLKKWALIHADGKYSLGTFDGKKFHEETPGRLSDIGGHNFYATQTFDNTAKADGRRIQMVWMRGSDFKDMPFSQQVSFPCELTLHETPAGLRLYRQPIQEIQLLHEKELKWEAQTLPPGQELTLSKTGDLFHIQAEVSIPAGATLTFNLRGNPIVLTSQSLEAGTGPHPTLQPVQTIEILLDRASIETFINQGELSATRRAQPKTEGLTLQANGGPVTIKSLIIHPLKSAWPTPSQ